MATTECRHHVRINYKLQNILIDSDLVFGRLAMQQIHLSAKRMPHCLNLQQCFIGQVSIGNKSGSPIWRYFHLKLQPFVQFCHFQYHTTVQWKEFKCAIKGSKLNAYYCVQMQSPWNLFWQCQLWQYFLLVLYKGLTSKSWLLFRALQFAAVFCKFAHEYVRIMNYGPSNG